MNNLQALAQRLMALDDKIAVCMRCGMCQSVCPTFRTYYQEADVARGRLVLINNLAHMLLKDPEALAEKLGRCLLCSSCQSVCPPGVKIMEIFREAREVVYGYLGLSPIKKLIFRAVLPNSDLFNFVIRAGAPIQGILFKKTHDAQGTVCAPMFDFLIGDRHIKPLAKKPLHSILGKVDEPRKEGGIKVAFFPGCVGDKMYVDMSLACIKVFRHHDVAIFIPEKQICCGIPAVCSGDADGMLKELKVNLEEFAKSDYDYVVTPCATCTSTIKELWPEYAERIGEKEKQLARDIAMKTMDINVFMVEVLGIKAAESPTASATPVTYHDPCHLVRSLGVTSEPREVLKANPQYKFVEMNDHDKCCGNGGSFNLLHYEFSRKIGQRKRDNVIASGARIVATSCPACMMQLEDVLSQNKDSVLVKHTVQLYAESLD